MYLILAYCILQVSQNYFVVFLGITFKMMKNLQLFFYFYMFFFSFCLFGKYYLDLPFTPPHEFRSFECWSGIMSKTFSKDSITDLFNIWGYYYLQKGICILPKERGVKENIWRILRIAKTKYLNKGQVVNIHGMDLLKFRTKW